MASHTGNQFPFAFGAADNSTYNFADGFAPAAINNMRFNGAYGTTPAGVPNYGAAYNAPPQHVPMGCPGLNQPMFAGTPTSHHPAAVTQSLPMANGFYNAPMPYGMHPGMPMAPQWVQQPVARLPMAHGRPNAAMFDVHAMPEQRPAPLVAPANLGNGVAYNALQVPAVAPVSVAPAARPAEVIDLTNEEPVAAPITPAAGTKRARGDRTSKGSAKPAKRPRYTAFGPYATPLATPPVVNTPSVSTTPTLSSSASASDSEVLPATPSPSARPRVPRKRPEDPHNLRGNIHYTFVAPHNAQLHGNSRPVYSRPEGLPATLDTSKRGRKDKKHSKASDEVVEVVEAAATDSTSEPVSFPETVQAQRAAEDGTDAEEDAEFELDDDVLASAAVAPAAVTPAAATPTTVDIADAPAADITFEAAVPVEEDHDDSEDIVFDDDGNVIIDAQGQPITAPVWRAQQAALLTPKDLPAACQKAAALNNSTLAAKRSFAAREKSMAIAYMTIAAAAKKVPAPKRPTTSQKKLPLQRPTVSQKKTPSQRPTVSGKKIPSQRPTVSGKKIPSQRPTVSGKKIPSLKPTVSKKQVTTHDKRAPSLVSDDSDDDDDNNYDMEAQCEAALQAALDADDEDDVESQCEAALATDSSDDDESGDDEEWQQETAKTAEDKSTLRDPEAKFGDFRQIRVKHDFEALQEALHDAWTAVGYRSGPLKQQWNAMAIKLNETDYDYWEYSEDES
ncbi:hypothetical protein MBLNU13_g02657t1 [Cladosporium sp. NU13]